MPDNDAMRFALWAVTQVVTANSDLNQRCSVPRKIFKRGHQRNASGLKESVSFIDRQSQHFGDLPEAQSFSAIAFDSEGLKRSTPQVCARRLKLGGNIVRNSQSDLHDVYFLLLNFWSRL